MIHIYGYVFPCDVGCAIPGSNVKFLVAHSVNAQTCKKHSTKLALFTLGQRKLSTGFKSLCITNVAIHSLTKIPYLIGCAIPGSNVRVLVAQYVIAQNSKTQIHLSAVEKIHERFKTKNYS